MKTVIVENSIPWLPRSLTNPQSPGKLVPVCLLVGVQEWRLTLRSLFQAKTFHAYRFAYEQMIVVPAQFMLKGQNSGEQGVILTVRACCS